MPDPRSESLRRRSQKCISWLGHKFEGRYSEEPSQRPSVNELFWLGTLSGRELIRASVKHTYERDICVRCGTTVEKING